jgi:hypothetical protein
VGELVSTAIIIGVPTSVNHGISAP